MSLESVSDNVSDHEKRTVPNKLGGSKYSGDNFKTTSTAPNTRVQQPLDQVG